MEYERRSRSDDYAIVFDQWEKELIARCVKGEIAVLEKRIQGVCDNPKNDGQVKYQMKIEEYRRRQKFIQELIKDFYPELMD